MWWEIKLFQNLFIDYLKCCSLSCRYIVVMQVFMLFMFFWTMNFVVAMGQMVLAGAFASYYWAFEKPKDIPAFPLSASLYRTFRSGSYLWYFVVPFTLFSCLWRSKLLSIAVQYQINQGIKKWPLNLMNFILNFFRYHFGSLAFGSLIIAIIQMIRVALEYLDHKLKGSENRLAKFFLKYDFLWFPLI